jgi:hypothetical protein
LEATFLRNVGRLFNGLHGVISQKTAGFFIASAVRTPKHTKDYKHSSNHRAADKPASGVHPEKLSVAQPLKVFPAFYG